MAKILTVDRPSSSSTRTLSDLPPVPLRTVLHCLQNGEYGDAELFAELFRGKCIYDHSDKHWYLWRGHYWELDREREIVHYICGDLASVYLRASAELNRIVAWAEPKGDVVLSLEDLCGPMTEEEEKEHDKKKLQQKQVKMLQARANGLKFLDKQRRILEMATAYLPMTGERWDGNPWVLGTRDGVIDLRTGVMRPGQPEDYIRTVIPAQWVGLDAYTQCPRFLRFLQEIFEDRPQKERDELIAFLQRILGYGLTGIVREHVFLFLYGDEGRNGKDTLMSLIRSILGDTVGPVPKDILLSTGKHVDPGGPKAHLITLQGKRIAWANEPDKGARFDVGQVKDLTGGGEITGRGMRENFRTFAPSHLLVLLTNHKPHADAKDQAFWERLCPIVFNLRFVSTPRRPNERKADRTLDAALQAESSAILAWMVQGCLSWQSHGLMIPRQVLRERGTYQQEEDTLGLFLRECCITGKDFEVACMGSEERGASSGLYTAYKLWCRANSIKEMSGTAFGKEMQKMFSKSERRIAGYFYLGIRLLEDGEIPPNEKTLQKMRDALANYPSDRPALSMSGQQYFAQEAIALLEESMQTHPIRTTEIIEGTLDYWQSIAK